MNKIKQLAIEVNELLTSFITLHNKVFNSSILTIFKPINFWEIHEDIKQVLSKLYNVRSKLGYDEDELSLTFKEYLERLILAAKKLFLITKGLHSNTLEANVYSTQEYQKDCKEYEDARLSYGEIGEKLNSLFSGL